MGAAVFGDVVAHSGRQERPEHIGEGKQKQCTTAERINRPDSGPCEGEVDETEAEGSEKRANVVGAGFDEDRGGVEGDDVDC